MSFNKITIVGNLGRDVELKYTPSGMAVANFSVATTESKKSKDDNWEKTTTWFKCTAWGKQAENANKYLAKGSNVYVEGRLSEEKWTDKDGNERSSLAVNVNDVQFLEKKDQASAATASSSDADATETKSAKTAKPDDSDIPF